MRRAEAAGCTALVVTVDSPVFGRRERDLRNGFLDLPPGMCCENLREPLAEAAGPAAAIAFSPELSWEHIDWLRSDDHAADRAQGRHAPGGRAHRGRARRRRAARLEPRRPPARHRAGRDRAAAGDRRRGRRTRPAAARRRHPARHRRRQGAGARSERRRASAGPCSGDSPWAARRAWRTCSRCCARSSTARWRCAAAARRATSSRDSRAASCERRDDADARWQSAAVRCSWRACPTGFPGDRRAADARSSRASTATRGSRSRASSSMPRTSSRSTPIPRRTAGAGAPRSRICSGTGSRPGPRSTRSTSSRESATKRSRARRAASSPCRGRRPRSSRRDASARVLDEQTIRRREAGPAARPDDAGLGRVLLRAGVRRALPAGRARADRRATPTTSSPRSSAAACGTWRSATG